MIRSAILKAALRPLCAVIGHKAGRRRHAGRHHYFATCDRCGADVMREGRGAWVTPPVGMRIIWRTIEEHRERHRARAAPPEPEAEPEPEPMLSAQDSPR